MIIKLCGDVKAVFLLIVSFIKILTNCYSVSLSFFQASAKPQTA